MKYFLIEGSLNNSVPFDEKILKEHISYSSKNAVDIGITLVSGVKADDSGGIFIMKAESLEKVETYLSLDPLKTSGMQEYRVTEIIPHYIHQAAREWF